MKLEVSKVPEIIEIKVHTPQALLSYNQKFIRLDIHQELQRKFDMVVEQRNLAIRRPDFMDGLSATEIIKQLDGELEMKSE